LTQKKQKAISGDRMNKIFRTAFALALFACANLLLISPAGAQSVYGSIFGTVSDESGAAVPDATVTVTDEAKGTIVSVTSNASGDYSVPHLIPDVYDLKVTAKGFKAFETKGIKVEADTAPRIDPTMSVGGSTETVQVSAEDQPLLKTDRADVSTVFDQQQVSSLPVGDQNFTNLQLLLPGAQKLGWSHAADENPQGSQQIQVDGQAFGGTAFELDGTDNQDPILGIIVINPAMDAVTETKITTQNFDAELGKAVSAVVTAQTRSGTNSFHGSAYDFRTGNANQARDPYTQATGIAPGLKNRFGGSIGGRVIKDKAFFFGNYEGQRQKVGTSASDTVPTAHLVSSCLSGSGCDFSEYATAYASSLGGKPLLTNNTGNGVDFSNNIIPNSMLSAPALTLLKLLQPFAPNTGGGAVENNFSENGTGLFNSDSWTVRGDYTLNEKMHAFARFSRFWDTLSGKVMFGDAGGPGFGILNYGGNSKGANDSLATGMDIAINSNLMTDFRLGYYRYNVIDSKYSTANLADTWGIPGINSGPGVIASPFTAGAPGFIIHFPFTGNQSLFGAGLGINHCNCPLTEREDQFQIVNNWTKVLGNHSVKVGVDLRYARNLRVPSDTDRAGQMDFGGGPTSANGTNGLGWASFVLGEVGNGTSNRAFGRYVSTSTNAKEFQKRPFFYAQDTWRVTHALTFNLGLRYELYFPEKVNAASNGSLMNLKDGYMHVAGVGGIDTNMGWGISYGKMFDPRIGAAYQLNDKTVIRGGYGRSFDTGVFGSIFGHVVTQNLPVLANQSINASSPTGSVFTLTQGPPAYTFPSVPSNGLLPAQAYGVSPKARPNPLHFPTIDAWNLALQRAVTPSLTLTMAYVGNKGTHTLGDTDQNNTDPNESALFLPGAYSRNGQTLHWDPSAPKIGDPATGGIAADGGVSNGRLLKRYYSGSLPSCKDSNYISLANLQAVDGDPNLTAGQCGWTTNIGYYGDDQNTEFDALQVTLAQAMWKGLSATANYEWASAFGDSNGFWTWSHVVTHYRDSNVRDQQLVVYGSYDLPFGKGKQFGTGVNHAADLLIGGYQLSFVSNWSSGLPFGLGFSSFGTNENCRFNTGDSAAPCRPDAHGTLKTNLSSPIYHALANDPKHGTITKTYWTPQTPTGGLFSFPGLDKIGNGGNNNHFGPPLYNADLALTKAFTIHESVAIKFRFDAFNAFNHISSGNPSNTDIFSSGPVDQNSGNGGNGYGGMANGTQPRQLEFSLRAQF
jgi:hypothetical protein